MQSNRGRTAVGLAAVAILVVAFFVIGGASTDDGATEGDGGRQQKITISNGEPVGGIAELTYSKGDEIDILVDSDTAGEVHLHGFDVMQDVEAGGTTEFKLSATLEGAFEMELEDTKTQIAELTVNP